LVFNSLMPKTSARATPWLHSIRGTSGSVASILLIDDDPGAIQLIERILADIGTLRCAKEGRDALRMAHESTPDLIVLNAQMPHTNALELIDTLRSESQLAIVPIIFVTNQNERGLETSAFERNVLDFIPKPLTASVVLARVQAHLRMKHTADELRRNATTDDLTGVATRSQLHETLEREWLRGLPTMDPISLLLVNVDRFSLYNERYGRPNGDACLREIAQTLCVACHRPADFRARLGGDEFVVLLPQTARLGAERVARRILEAVAALGISHEDCAPHRRLSVSLGISYFDESSICWVRRPEVCGLDAELYSYSAASDLLLAANEALRSAKNGGRAQCRLLDIAELDATDPEQPRTCDRITESILAQSR
jgi:diguanylate cyclase (GGDEF)-like protein